MHGGLDCLINIIESNQLQPETIDRIEVYIDPLVTLPAWKVEELQSHVDTQFCAAYPFAAAAFRLKSGAEWQDPANYKNRVIRLTTTIGGPHPEKRGRGSRGERPFAPTSVEFPRCCNSCNQPDNPITQLSVITQ